MRNEITKIFKRYNQSQDGGAPTIDGVTASRLCDDPTAFQGSESLAIRTLAAAEISNRAGYFLFVDGVKDEARALFDGAKAKLSDARKILAAGVS